MDLVTLYGLAVVTNLVFQTNVGLFHREIAHYGLSTPVPIRAREFRQFSYSFEDHSFALILTNGWSLWYDYGRLTGFESPVHQHPERGPAIRTDGILTQAEAIETAKNVARKTGLSDREMYLHLDPDVFSAPKMPWHPFFTVEWNVPNEWSGNTLSCDVDCRDGSVVHVFFSALYRHLLRENAAKRRAQRPTVPPPAFPRSEPVLESRLVAIVCEQLRRWAPDAGYPTDWIDENKVRQQIFWRFADPTKPQKSWRAVLGYTNDHGGDWAFAIKNGRLTSWTAPDTFFLIEHPEIEDFTGEWQMSETQAADLVRKQVRKMGFPPDRLGFVREKPTLARKPRLIGSRYVVPRIRLVWQDSRSSEVEAEVDADARKLKSLVVLLSEPDDQSYFP